MTGTVPSPYFATAPPHAVRLFVGDALDLFPAVVGPGGADVVVTSPPYNRGVAYASYDDRRPRTEYLAWIGRVADRVRDGLAPDGSFFLNVGGSPKDPWLPWDVARVVGDRLVLQNVLHWVKSIAIDREAAGRTSGIDRDVVVGHYKPLVSERFVHNAHEYVFHFSHRGDVPIDRLAIGVPYGDSSNVARWAGARRGVRCRGNTWFLPYGTIRSADRDRPHPASFPPDLPERCFRLHGVAKIRLAVDPFVGIGPSAVAAARVGVPFVGIDLEASYLDVAAAAVRRAFAAPAAVAHRTSRAARGRPRAPTTN